MNKTLIKALQQALTDLGYDPGPVDGLKGPLTVAAAQMYLRGVAADGGLVVLEPVKFKGRARRLDDIDLPREGARIGVGEDEIHAVIDVEARGSGFDSEGRVAMLFEPHVFWRELGPGAKRDRAAAQGLAYPRWRPGSYPKDSYPRLHAAVAIDEEAALRSSSWGLGQIMGFNAQMVGYDSARDMVEAFADDEENHLNAMISFIVAAGLDDNLRRHDWTGFARGYNGPSHAEHDYAGRLRRRYEWWQGKPDTPFQQSPEVTA